MPSRQGSVSLHSLDSPPSQTRLVYPLVQSAMHDHSLDYQSDRYSVDPYGAVPAPSSTGSPPYDYIQPAPGVGALMSAGAARPKRKQVKNACSACQRACKRCDVGRPCERCIKYGMQDSCRDSLRKERKKGVKRGPYKKRDGMLNDLQRMSSMPVKTRTSRVSSISEAPSQPSTSSVSQMDQTAPPNVSLYVQQVPSARPNEGSFSYQNMLMIPAPTQHPSLASMHSSSSHANMHHSGRGEDQYYQPRYDQLAHGSASARPSHYRMDSYSVQQQPPQQQPQPEYDTKQHVQMLDHRSMRALQHPASDESPPRERHYSSQIYNDNHPRHTMVQTSPDHHDVPYSQPDPVHDSPRAIETQYSYATQHQQHQRSYERTYQDRSFQEQRPYQDRSYQDRSYQDRSYANEIHVQDAGAQPEIQQSQQQQQYYSSYNAYQSQPSSSYSSQSQSYGYSQNHASPHSMATAQRVSDQADPGYMGRAAADQVSYGSSINSYPTQQQQQVYPSQNPMGAAVQYSMRPSGRVMHRDMVAHPHVGNVSIQSN